jgi:hypothetical protein
LYADFLAEAFDASFFDAAFLAFALIFLENKQALCLKENV